MIHMKKPAPYSPTRETIEYVVITRDKRFCRKCGVYVGEQPPHHWGLHNKKSNRDKYPLLVHHHSNLVLLCVACHKDMHGKNKLPEYRAGVIELVLATGGTCYFQIEEDGSFNICTIPLAKPD